MLRADQKIVIVTRETRLQAVKKRYGTRAQAKFLMERSREIEASRRPSPAAAAAPPPEAAFAALELEDELYEVAVGTLQDELDLSDLGLKVQKIDRTYVPTFLFGPQDVVVTVGQDGLVANVAKYAVDLPIVAVNPDPAHIDGVLLPFRADQARAAVRAVLAGRAKFREIVMAEATLTDGQRLLAFNDFFIGNRTHVSARYRIEVDGRSESHSSSGVLVSTGAGSTGWLSSVFNMQEGVRRAFAQAAGPAAHAPPAQPPRLRWEDPRLAYVVREPFVSKSSAASIVAGVLEKGRELVVESMMASDGVVFSDGVESDFLPFTSGVTARVRVADKRARLVIGN
jgi:NAD kinase